MTGKIQTKDIPDQAMIDLIDRLYNVPRVHQRTTYGDTVSVGVVYSSSATLGDIYKMWDNIPPKVILAKLKKLIDKNKIDGCACGCHGRFTVIHEGEVPIELYWDEVECCFKSRRIIRGGRCTAGH